MKLAVRSDALDDREHVVHGLPPHIRATHSDDAIAKQQNIACI
jgi:hypothetical protein